MSLTYKQTIRRETEEVKEFTIKTPKHWGMYTFFGNSRIAGYAQTYYNRIEKATKTSEIVIAAEKFLEKFTGLYDKEGYQEAGDTAVREQVWSFLVLVCKAKGYDEKIVDEVYDRMV